MAKSLEKDFAEDGAAEKALQDLAESLHSMSPKLQQAARYIVDHPMEVGVNSMRKLADMAGVTPNTLTRLSRLMGHDSYQGFQNLFREAVRQHTRAVPDRARWLQTIGSGSPHALVISQMASALLFNLEQLFSTLDAAELELVARRIVDARKLYVMGVRGAYSLAHNFHYVARMAIPDIQLVPRHASPPIDDIAHVTKGDVVIAVTMAPYARDTYEAAEYAAGQGALVIAVTDSRASPIARHADHVLVAPSGTPHFFNSITGAGAVLETLLALLVVTGDKSMLASIRLIDNLRRDGNAYWDNRSSDSK